LEEYPLPDGLEPIPEDVLLEPKWLLELADAKTEIPQNHDAQSSISTNETQEKELPPTDLLNVQGGLTARITHNQRLTPNNHWQDVRQLTLDINAYHPYTPGDILTIYPKNFPSDVNQFLHTMSWTTIADAPLKFIPSPSTSASSSSLPPIPHISPGTTMTLRQLLTNHLDIMSIPRRSFFAHLTHFTTDTFHRDRLLEFTNPEYIDELYDYTTRPRRSILEVLQEFDTVKIPFQRICSLIPTLRGRQFSIASAMSNLDAQREGRTRVELLIAIVMYKTVIKRIRHGVCTRYISAALQPGQEITVTVQKGGLGVTKKEVERPVVMVGPGTGVAPMRSLIYQRKIWREELGMSSDAVQRDLLFFGCRNAESDFFFKDEWEGLKKEGVPLDVFAAFSRDQVCLFLGRLHLDANTDIITATESIRARPCTLAWRPNTRSPRQTQRSSIYMRLIRQNAASRTRGADRSHTDPRKHDARGSRSVSRRHGEERALQTRNMVDAEVQSRKKPCRSQNCWEDYPCL
jgi:sulfite reductase alpha subunit-like flavoprotein